MRKATTPIVVAILLVLALAVGVSAQAVSTNFTWVVTKLLTVTDAATFTDDVDVAGATGLTTLLVSGNSNLSGNLIVDGYYAGQSETYFIPAAATTVTNGAVITPTGTVLELTSAGAVGAELTAGADGRLLIIVNVGSQSIVISDTASIESTGDITLGANDTLTLIGSGVKWYQIAASNN